jgi:hypothetical protein
MSSSTSITKGRFNDPSTEWSFLSFVPFPVSVYTMSVLENSFKALTNDPLSTRLAVFHSKLEGGRKQSKMERIFE